MSDSRDIILETLKEAGQIPTKREAVPQDLDERIARGLEKVTPKTQQGLIEQFQKELELVSGEFHRLKNANAAADIVLEIMKQNGYEKITVTGENICQRISDIMIKVDESIVCVDPLNLPYPERKELLAEVPIALVEASFGITDIGALVFPYDDSQTSLPHFLSECVISVISGKNLVPNQFDLFDKLPPEKAKNMVFIAGPSRTADIEKILILGAHGPRRLVVLMFD